MFSNYCSFEEAKVEFILKSAGEYAEVFECKPIDLRSAFIRYVYFQLGSLGRVKAEKILLSNGSIEEKIGMIGKEHHRNKSWLRTIPGLRYWKRDLMWLGKGRGLRNEGLPLIVVHHHKFVSYLKRSRIFEGIKHSWLATSPEVVAELGLSGDDRITRLRCGKGFYREKYPINELLTCAGDLEATILYAQPKVIFTVEGDAPYHSLLTEIGKKHNIPVYCFQWGIFGKTKLKTAFSEMKFTSFLSWGELFESQLREYNPGLSFYRMGRLSSVKRNRSGENIIFVDQAEGQHIEKKDSDMLVQLAVSLSQVFKNRVTWRSHPNNPTLHTDLEVLRNAGVRILDSRGSLDKQLVESVMAVGITSSALVDALDYEVIPVSFNTTCLKGFPVPIVKLGIGFEFEDLEFAMQEIVRLLGDVSAMKVMQKQIRSCRGRVFGETSLSEQQQYIRSLG